MNAPSGWFDDEEVLVRELRRSQRDQSAPRIPGYERLEEVRRGGQGVVFVGTQASTRRRVAIKLVLDGALATREARRRFEREIELVAGLRHPHIVRVYDSGETADGRLYYVMDYIEGVGLDELTHDGAPLVKGANRRGDAAGDPLMLFAKICDGVQYAHQQGVIHRDLKPSNVRVDRQGEPHILDFGLAKWAGVGLDVTQVSRSGSFMGSLPWASPEQAEGTQRQVDVRSDVYSLGVILYQFLTGTFPYRVDGTLRESLQNIQNTPARSPREIRPAIGDELSTIALKCLAKEPERRYQSAGELARDIRRYMAGEPIEAKRDSAWYAVRKTMGRYRTAARAASILLVLSLIFSATMVWLRARAVAAEKLAEQRLLDVEKAHQAEIESRQALETQVSKNKKVSAFLDTTLRTVDPWKHPGRNLGPLRDMLDGAVKRLDGAFPDQPDVEAAIAGTLGWDYRKLGVYESAEPLLQRSYELSLCALGESHPDTLVALDNLATLMTDCGRHAEAEPLFERLRALQERTLGPENPATLVTLNNLALDLDWQGRSNEAEALFRRALEAQTRLFGPTNPERMNTLNNLAACLPAVGKAEEAEQLHYELIEARTVVFGAEHPETLQARMNLADLVVVRGRLAEAEEMLRVLLKDLEAALTPDHPLTNSALHELANVVSNRGRPEEGLALSRRAFAAQVAFAGPDHPTTLNRKNELACTLIDMKRWDEAIPLATELRDQYERMLGAGDWRTLTAAGNLAYALHRVEKSEEAAKLWKQIIADADPAHEATAVPLVSARANLGALLADRANWEPAEAEFRAAIEIQEQRGDGDHWRTAFIRAGLGRVLIETDRMDAGERELTRAYGTLQKSLGDEHEKTQTAVGYLVRLYEKRGDAAAVADFRSKLVAH